MDSTTYLVWSCVVITLTCGIIFFCLVKNHKLACFVFVLALAFTATLTVLSHVKTTERLRTLTLHYESGQANTTIPNINTASNGLYYNLGSYRASDGSWLTIIQAAQITSVDTTNKIVYSMRTDESTALVSAPHPLMSQRFLGRSPATGFVIIGETDNNGKTIEDFNPFK